MNLNVNKEDEEYLLSILLEDLSLKSDKKLILSASIIKTELGKVIVICDHKNIYLLEFLNKKNLMKRIIKFKTDTNAKITIEKNNTIINFEKELNDYFVGKTKVFKIPVLITGTDFEKKVWSELLKIPYGKTISYKQLAKNVGNENAFRAVANANNKNLISIVIPCHRVISYNGKIGGYSGGIDSKKWLLNLESTAN